MPSDRRNQTRGGNNGGSGGSSEHWTRPIGRTVREGANRVEQGVESVGEALAQGYRGTRRMITRHPGSSVLIGFGVGFGLGMLLSQLLTEAEHASWFDPYVPEALRRLPERARHLPEALARSMPGH